MEIAFRPAFGSDIAYIKNSWLESYRNGDGVRGIPNTFYYHYEELLIRKNMARCSNSHGLVIAYEHEPDLTMAEILKKDILGWICCEALEDSLLVHYVYTRGHDTGRASGKNYRRQGIASALVEHCRAKYMVEDQPVYYTYRTSVCWQPRNARDVLKRFNAVYLPYPKWTLAPDGWETGKIGGARPPTQ